MDDTNKPLFYYYIRDNGDGSSSLCAFATRDAADISYKEELEEYGYVPSEGVHAFFKSDIDR